MKKVVFAFVGIVILSLILFPQLFYAQILGGDYVSLSRHTLWNKLIAPSWGTEVDIGWNTIPFLQYYFFSLIQYALAFILGSNYVLVEKITWWGLYIFLSIFSSLKLSSYFFNKKIYLFVSAIIFTLNTYSLMILSGGQIAGIGLAYSLSPLLFYSFIKLLDENTLSRSLEFSLLLSLSIIFDLRITYILVVVMILFFFYKFILSFSPPKFSEIKKVILYLIFIPGVVVLITHLYWILPSILYRAGAAGQLGVEYTSTAALSFFSFAKLENSITLLHPNWPENFFGKVHFMNPLFLIIPILIGLGFMLITDNDKKKHFTFFLLLFLISAFLAKGVNMPFGFFYELGFNNIPGFILLRDPTKWYTLIAIACSILIPFSLQKIGYKFQKIKFIPFIFILFYLFLLLNPFIFGELNGTFIKPNISGQYKDLQNEINNDKDFSRVLWFPSPHYSKILLANHPIIFPSSYLKKSDLKFTAEYFLSDKFRSDLLDYAVGYVVLFEDRESKIYLKEPTYTKQQYASLSAILSSRPFLIKDNKYKELSLYKVTQPAKKFRITVGELNLRESNPDKYVLNITSSGPASLTFSETFNPFWRLVDQSTGKIVNSKPNGRINSFNIDSAVNSDFVVEFFPRHLMTILIPLSICAWLLIMGVYIGLRISKKHI